MGSVRSTILLTLGVEINAADSTLALVEADIIEAFKARTTNCAYTVIRYQEVFLPSHKYVLSLCQTRNVKVPLARLLLERKKSSELGPMMQINLISRTPIFMLCEKRIFGADNLAFEIGGKSWVVLGEA
jgi:hypothetical protein